MALPSSFPSEGILPRGGAAVLVAAEDAPKENAGAGEEALGAAELLPNENTEVDGAAVDGAAVVGSVAGLSPNENLDVSFLLSLSLVADPKEKGLVASLEAAGAVVLASLVVAPNENPPEADEVVAVDEASNLKPPEDAAAVSLVAAATNLKPAEEDVVVELVEAGAPN